MHQVGSGVLGPVYRARRSDRDFPPERAFALKAFQVDLTPEQTIVFGGALREMADPAWSHAAVVGPVGAGVADGVPYVAYEYVDGESLDVRMRPRAPLAAEAALPYIVQIAEALDAAHTRGLVHGALHLRDVLITPAGARVGGFGIVAALDRVGHRCPLRPPYAAPEQMAGAEWGAAADRYALAAVACELLTGRRAAVGGGTAGNVERVLDAQAAPRLTALLDAALARDPAGRPRSAGRLADDLAGALSWTGVAGVRRALAGASRDGVKESGDSGRAESNPAAAAGGAALPGEEPVVAAVGGTVMSKRRKRMPWRGKQSEVDWTDRALDLGLPDERSGTEGGGPQSGDVAARERASASRGDPIDAALEAGGAAGDEHDAGGDLDLRAGADALADVAEGLHAGLRDGRGTAAGADPEEVDPDSDAQAADGYSPISVGELESRVAGGGEATASVDGPSGAASEPRYVTEGGGGEMLAGDPDAEGREPDSSGSAGTGDVEDDEDEFALTPEEGYDYGLEDEAEPEDAAGEIFGRGPADQARRLPVALVAGIGVAVAVTAFVIGLGWMGGEDGDAAIADEAGAAADPARAFSEAVVDDAATEPPAAAVETGNEAPEAGAALRGDGPPAARSAGESSPAARVPVPERPPAAPRRTASVAAPESPPPPEPVAAEGRLLVRSMPPGAEVIVNGESRGTTPLALAELPYGPYEVEVSLAGYPPRREGFLLDAGDPIGSLNADLAAASAAAPAAGGARAGSPSAGQVGIGSILAETRPPGAAVWLDQRLVGETPVSIPDVPAGAHHIEFRLDGYRTWTTTVEVAPATQARVAASLADAAR